MKTEEVLFEIDQINKKYKGVKVKHDTLNSGMNRIDESIKLLNQWKSELCKEWQDLSIIELKKLQNLKNPE